MINPELILENHEKFLESVRAAKFAMEDLTLPLKQVGLMLFKSQRVIFALKGPGLYPDLSRRYKVRKQKRWGSVYPILKASGRLEKSTTEPANPDAVMDIVNKDTLYWGTRVPYAIYHQSMEPRKTKLPRRPILLWGPDTRYEPEGPGTRLGRAQSILRGHALRALGQDVPTGGED